MTIYLYSSAVILLSREVRSRLKYGSGSDAEESTFSIMEFSVLLKETSRLWMPFTYVSISALVNKNVPPVGLLDIAAEGMAREHISIAAHSTRESIFECVFISRTPLKKRLLYNYINENY